MMTAKSTICLWFDKDAEAAADFYPATFPDSSVGAILRAPSDYPSGKAGDVLTVEFTVAGIPNGFVALENLNLNLNLNLISRSRTRNSSSCSGLRGAASRPPST